MNLLQLISPNLDGESSNIVSIIKFELTALELSFGPRSKAKLFAIENFSKNNSRKLKVSYGALLVYTISAIELCFAYFFKLFIESSNPACLMATAHS